MSRIYDALKRAELPRERLPQTPREPTRDRPHERVPERHPASVSTPLDPPPAPAPVVWDVGDDARLEYERLQVWITNRAPDSPAIQTVMVASCQRGNGATTTAVGLAATLARRPAARVLLVDADLRAPALHRVLGVPDRAGFRELLGKGEGCSDHVQTTAHANLFVMTSGLSSSSALEVYSAAALARVVTELKSRFDFIVFDTSPFLEFPDAYALAPHLDAVLLVVEADRTLVDDARRAMRELQRSGLRAAGVVLNRQRNYTPRLLRRALQRTNGISH
jgi:capsular exopolysaccharide synthesis family protein